MGDKPKTVTLESWTGEKVEVLGADYEPGRPDVILRWQDKLADRKQRLAYLRTADRYWYAESFGSEKRKNPA
jgi:hypothetical protein